MSMPGRDDTRAQALIPGAYERRAVNAQRPGAMSGPAAGSLQPPGDSLPMDDATRAAHRKEGGEVGQPRPRHAARDRE
jgi:hypothetical protein